MSSVIPYLSTRVDARGKAEILLRFSGGRKYVYRLHSQLYISPSRWKDGDVAMPRFDTDEATELREIHMKIEQLSMHLISHFAEADKALVNRRWMQRAVDEFHHPRAGKGDPMRLNDAFALFLEQRGAKVSHWQLARYDVVSRSLVRWEKYRGAPVMADGVGRDELDEYNAFLHDEHKLVRLKRWEYIYEDMPSKLLPRERGENTIIQYLDVLRVFYRWAKAEGYTTAEPFAGYTLETPRYGTPYYITLEELEQLYATDLSRRPGLAVQRDIFVFQCQVGCRVGDLLRFRQDDIADGILEYVPSKTAGDNPRTVRVPLNARAREILERYADDAYPKLLPFISMQKYNEAIKDAFKLAGLTRPVTILDPRTRKAVKHPLNEVASSHLARRTFIGNLYKAVKDPSLISSMSGHVEGSRAFARYRTIDDDMKSELVTLLEGKAENNLDK